MITFRDSPSGPVVGRRIASGTLTIPIASDNIPGPVLKRRANERIWVYVFPVTLTPGFYGLVALPVKDNTMAVDEWAFLMFLVSGPTAFPITADWTAYGGLP